VARLAGFDGWALLAGFLEGTGTCGFSILIFSSACDSWKPKQLFNRYFSSQIPACNWFSAL